MTEASTTLRERIAARLRRAIPDSVWTAAVKRRHVREVLQAEPNERRESEAALAKFVQVCLDMLAQEAGQGRRWHWSRRDLLDTFTPYVKARLKAEGRTSPFASLGNDRTHGRPPVMVATSPDGMITVSAEPWIPAIVVRRLYAAMQEGVNEKNNRPLKAASLTMYRWVTDWRAAHQRTSWRETLTAWNKGHGRTYKDVRNLHRDYRRIARALTR